MWRHQITGPLDLDADGKPGVHRAQRVPVLARRVVEITARPRRCRSRRATALHPPAPSVFENRNQTFQNKKLPKGALLPLALLSPTQGVYV